MRSDSSESHLSAPAIDGLDVDHHAAGRGLRVVESADDRRQAGHGGRRHPVRPQAPPLGTTAFHGGWRPGRWHHWIPVRPMDSIASTIARCLFGTGAPRCPGGSHRSTTSSHRTSDGAIAKLMPAILGGGRCQPRWHKPSELTGRIRHKPSAIALLGSVPLREGPASVINQQNWSMLVGATLIHALHSRRCPSAHHELPG